ncbi:MAG: hypothetical protein U0Z44_21215 [Kouleothrix sp.]
MPAAAPVQRAVPSPRPAAQPGPAARRPPGGAKPPNPSPAAAPASQWRRQPGPPPREEAPAAEPAPAVAAPGPPAPAPRPHATAEIASDNAAAAMLELVETQWEDILLGIKAQDRTLYVLMTSSGGMRAIDLKDDVIIFEVKNEWQIKRLEQPNPRRLIEKVLSKYMGANYRISCVAETEHRESPNVRREQIRNSRKDPHIKAAINIFDADIIDIEQQS